MQIQRNKKTVQGEIQKALKKLGIEKPLTHAGRTDRGVHALNQVITFEAQEFWELEKLKTLLNRMLLPNIYFKKLEKVDSSFHPRFSAKKRSYRYILSKKTTPFIANYTTHYPEKIDLHLLKEALKIIEGEHDFEYFAKTGSVVNSYIRTIYKTNIFEYKDFVVIKFLGNGFLRSQIRILVNFLLEINEGKESLETLKKQLEKQKLHSKKLAPPNGLYLERIFY